MQETAEEREACLEKAMERAWARTMQETTEEKEAHLKIQRGKHR